jgi:hypothetical protein
VKTGLLYKDSKILKGIVENCPYFNSNGVSFQSPNGDEKAYIVRSQIKQDNRRDEGKADNSIKDKAGEPSEYE